MKILVVEDDIVTLEMIRSSMAALGHHVLVAKDGFEAWEVYQEESPWLVISDWRMPKMDGLELCERIRQEPSLHYTYFILITAYAELREDYLNIMSRGVDDFLRKPIDLDDLKVRLQVANRMSNYNARIRSLEGLVTICAYTKKIKLTDHTWLRIEDFIENTLGLQLTHGVDPEYYQQNIVPELERLKKQAQRN